MRWTWEPKGGEYQWDGRNEEASFLVWKERQKGNARESRKKWQS
jgi:hypothetical protein